MMFVTYRGDLYTVYSAQRGSNTLIIARGGTKLTVDPIEAGTDLVVIGDVMERLTRDYGIQFTDPFIVDPVVSTEW